MAQGRFRRVAFADLFNHSGEKGRDFGRADVVLLHCYVDSVLERLLRRALIRHRLVASMFTPGGAMWAFTSKVAVAFALGLLTPAQRDDLLLVNKIRNRVAHNFRNATFRDRDLKKWASQLRYVREERAYLQGRTDDKSRGLAKYLGNGRNAFGWGVIHVAMEIDVLWNVRRLRPPRPRRIGAATRKRAWPRCTVKVAP